MKSYSGTKKKFNPGLFAGRFFLYLFLILLAIICITPFYMMIVNATRSTHQITLGISLIPGKALIENYIAMMTSLNIWKGFLNSLIITVPSTVLSAYVGTLAAYGFSKFRFRGNKFLFWIVLGTMMVPIQLGIIGYYQIAVKFHLVNTYWAIILPAIASAYSVFFLKMYIDSNLDYSLIEAARVDGSSEFRTFHLIVLPIVMPAISTVSILNFITSWNNFLIPLTLLNDKDKFTLPILITMVKGTYKQNLGAQYLAVAISIVPILIIFAIFSRFIIGGMSAGALKE